MKKISLFALIAIVMASCGNNDQCQVKYPGGKVEWVTNEISLDIHQGDSLIIKHYTSFKSVYSSDDVYGIYEGQLPERYIDSSCAFTYDIGVVIK